MERGLELSYEDTGKKGAHFSAPGSKSIAARAMILDALAGGDGELLHNIPDCNDSRELRAALDIMRSSTDYCDLDLGTGGTSLRFFVSLAASTPGVVSKIDCSEALKRRPLLPLLEALETLGARIEYPEGYGNLPIIVHGQRQEGGEVTVDAGISSQFVSSLMMCAPLWRKGLRLRYCGRVVSRPYIEMTASMMRDRDADVTVNDCGVTVKPGSYQKKGYDIEGDWSAAGYFYEYVLLTGKDALIEHLSRPEESLQGDSRVAELCEPLGIQTSELDTERGKCLRLSHVAGECWNKSRVYEADMGATPDLVPALCVGLCCTGIRFRLSNIAHLRHKESDRLAALQQEMGRRGYVLEIGEDWLSWAGEKQPVRGVPVIDTHGDHRIAMSMAISAVTDGPLALDVPEVVDKSFPDFYKQMGENGIGSLS